MVDLGGCFRNIHTANVKGWGPPLEDIQILMFSTFIKSVTAKSG